MDKIQKTLSWIDQRVENYLSLLKNIVFVYTKDSDKSKEAESLLRTTLRMAFFLDFYSETDDKDFLHEANKYKKLMYSSMSKKDRFDLKLIEKRIIKLFDYEKQIWTKIKEGKSVSNEEIEKYWAMKSSDSLFYGRAIKIFTGNKDFTLPLYVYTQVLDIGLDLREYEKDFQENCPNILFMKLSQKIPISEISPLKKEAIKKAILFRSNLDLNKIVEKLVKQISTFDFGECSFLKKAIDQKREEFYAEFC